MNSLSLLCKCSQNILRYADPPPLQEHSLVPIGKLTKTPSSYDKGISVFLDIENEKEPLQSKQYEKRPLEFTVQIVEPATPNE